MMGLSNGAPRGLRWGIFVLAIAVAIVAIGADPADARGRRKKRAGPAYNPPYAAIVVDANSGRVLHAANADSLRHPASVTKVMTLYLLFEQVESGKLRLNSDLPVSAHAASQAPSKLGLRPGQTIEVEDAIKALVTKSANDVAVVIAEAIGGSEDDFAELMTRKAKSLGMARTVYANASGLPNDDQVTTARDQATLGRAIQDRFPKFYRYFSTNSFTYRGRAIRNHNHLLGRVDGVDGIKTGYIRASGFNLLASLRRDGRHLVAVVMGGSSGGARDARMRQLLESNVVEASVRRTAPVIAEARDDSETPTPLPRRAPREPIVVAAAAPIQSVTDERAPPPEPVLTSAPLSLAAPAAEGSADPIKPILVRTVAVTRGRTQVASAVPGPTLAGETRSISSAVERPAATADARAMQRPAPRGGWVIQIGAFPAETQAKDRLKAAQNVAKTVLASAEPFTERVVKRDSTLYRARFAGFDRGEAQAACNYLKRNEIACLAVKN